MMSFILLCVFSSTSGALYGSLLELVCKWTLDFACALRRKDLDTALCKLASDNLRFTTQRRYDVKTSITYYTKPSLTAATRSTVGAGIAVQWSTERADSYLGMH